jgi:hypothetical protein
VPVWQLVFGDIVWPWRLGPDDSGVITIVAVTGFDVEDFVSTCHELAANHGHALLRHVRADPHSGCIFVAPAVSHTARGPRCHPRVCRSSWARATSRRWFQPATVIGDGDPALPALVGTAAGRPVTHILDWFHISMRVRHIEQAVQGSRP